MDKVLSIIIPTYNMEKYLRKCLDSLIIDEEGMKQLEVLVINDGSKDSSSKIAHEYQDKYLDTFRVIDKENGNYGSCINRGLKEAMGKYVKVLDADDWFDTISFHNYFVQLKNIDCDVVINNFSQVDEQGNITDRICYNIESGKYLGFNVIPNAIAMHAIAYKTSNLRAIAYKQTEGISYTDQEWIFSPMSMVTKVYMTGCDVYRYLVGREGQTVSKQLIVKNINHTVQGFWSMINVLPSINVDSLHRTYINYKLERRIRGIYRTYLFNEETDLDELIKFDNKLKKECLELYQSSENYRINYFKFIKLWRKNRHRRFGKLLRYVLQKQIIK